MKERTDKQPLDDLFARKLQNMSLPPGPDGFARLQARMGQGSVEPEVVFWQNPTVHRYMAVAACLLFVCLFGWLYLTKESDLTGKGTIAAVKPEKTEQSVDKPARDVAATQVVPEQVLPDQTNAVPVESPSKAGRKAKENEVGAGSQAMAAVRKPVVKPAKLPLEIPVLETVKPTEQLAKTDISPVTTEPVVEKQIMAAVSKPVPAAERVLVVTITEPEALVAARRNVKAPVQEGVLADTDAKADKETKAGALWSQVKRLKQGEIFARKDEVDDERGLIGRAYSGLK
ncbi:hypothetical protein LC612_40730, partial [Nostoc sp. CHAB 5834]|nr:hypothetical protein [Nostoc sp. CHAB 5834]